jgi:hypothetical protein
MADPETPAVPEDPTEALRHAAACIQYAAGYALTDGGTLPDEWYARYGAVKEIFSHIADFARSSIDAVPRGFAHRELYVDELGEPAAPESVVGQWIVRTNAAIFGLGNVAENWDIAQNRLGRLGVRDTEETPG